MARNIAIAIASLIGSWIAIRGLSVWREEHLGKEDYSLAKRWLLSALKVRDEFMRSRASLITFGEMKEAAIECGVEPEEFRLLDAGNKYNGQIFQKRLNRLWDAFSNFNLNTLEAEAAWGQAPLDAFKGLDDLAKKLAMAMRRYVSHMDNPNSNLSHEKLDELEEIIWDGWIKTGAKDNDFEKKIEEAMLKIKQVANPYLKAHYKNKS